jgi:hypothetical protein
VVFVANRKPHEQPPVPPGVASGVLTNFRPLPSNPADLTVDDLEALFPVANRKPFLKELARIAREAAANDAA